MKDILETQQADDTAYDEFVKSIRVHSALAFNKIEAIEVFTKHNKFISYTEYSEDTK